MRGLSTGLLPLVLLAACEAGTGDQNELPEPSGPPVAQQIDAAPPAGDAKRGPVWEYASTPRGRNLHLTEGDKLVMTLGCVTGSRGLTAFIASFQLKGGADRPLIVRFGQETVTLMPDVMPHQGPGVGGSGPLPGNLGKLLDRSGTIGVLFGDQEAGPYPAPGPELRKAFAKDCGA